MTATFRRALPDLTPEVELELVGLGIDFAELRAQELKVARRLARVARLDPARFGTPSGIGELGERYGASAEQTRALRDLGSAVHLEPELGPKVLAGAMPTASAALVGQVFFAPWLLREGDDWIRWAETDSTKQLRQRVYERRESYAQGRQPVVARTVYITHAGDRAFDRARQVASQMAKRSLTPGQTFEGAMEHFLDDFDPLRVKPGKRRMPDTREAMAHGASGKQFRGVPAEVRREIHARQQGRCAVAFCDRAIFLEMAHVIAHGKGGHREADNLLGLCSYHHPLFDAGLIRLTGKAVNPAFVDERGCDLMRRIGAVAGDGSRAANGSVSAAEGAAETPPEPPMALPRPPEAPRKAREAPETEENGGPELLASGPAPP